MKQNLEKGDKYTHMFIRAIQSGVCTKIDAAGMLGISRPTLDSRIKDDKWRKLEKTCIKDLVLIK